MALPKKYRLTKNKDFTRVKQKGTLYSHSLLGLLVLENKELENKENIFPQFGFIISAKVAKKASPRFKLKRQLSEIVYELIPQFKSNLQIVFLPKKALFVEPFLEIKKAVKEVFAKAKVFRK